MWFLNFNVAEHLKVNNAAANYIAAKKLLKGEEAVSEELKADLEIEKKSGAKLSEEIARLNKSKHLGSLPAVKKLPPEDDFAQQLVQMSEAREGPWSDNLLEIPVTISIVSYLPGRSAAACYDSRFDDTEIALISKVELDGDTIRSEAPILINSVQRVDKTSCKSPRKFDLQVSCALALEILTHRILGRQDGEPRWVEGFRNLLAATTSVVEKKM